MLLGLILTDEALLRDGFEAFRQIIHAQPVWSDLPAILLTSSATEPDAQRWRAKRGLKCAA